MDWVLKQILRVWMSHGIPADRCLYEYGLEPYSIADTPEDCVWVGDFTPEQRTWSRSIRGEHTSKESSARGV